jgi:hypothetical protein
MERICRRKMKSYPVSHSLAAISRTSQRQYNQFKPNTTFSVFTKKNCLLQQLSFCRVKFEVQQKSVIFTDT